MLASRSAAGDAAHGKRRGGANEDRADDVMPLAGPATRIVDPKNRRVLPGLPDIPAIAEFVPEYDSSQWHGVSAPKQTPAEIVGKLDREITIENNTSGPRVGPQATSRFCFSSRAAFQE